LVGAAVFAANGQIYAGCNVENASYGLTICAERAAVFQAVAGGVQQLLAIAIATTKGVTPCGACRQVLSEFAEDMPILLVDPAAPMNLVEMSLNQLLPHRFMLREPTHPKAASQGGDAWR
jgi:cytidine deaminase